MIASVLTGHRGPFSIVLLVVAGLVIASAAIARACLMVIGIIASALIVRAPREYALVAKAVFRDALALHGVTHAQLGRLLGVSVAVVDAALSDARDASVPFWWSLHPALPEAVRSYVVAEIALRTEASVPSDPPEVLVQHALIRVGKLVTAASATLTPGVVWRIGAEAAAQLLRQISDAIISLGAASRRLQRRAITGAQSVAKGGAR